MTTIIAISDTHLGTQPLSGDKYLHQDTINLIENAQLVLHAGDFNSQEAYNFLSEKCKPPCELWAIQGNSPDPVYISPGNKLPPDIIDKRFGIKIGLIHDYNGEANNSYDFSESEALDIADSMHDAENRFIGVDLMVFGHIHEPIVSWNKDNMRIRRLLVCPGYGTMKGYNHKCPDTPTAAKIIVDNGKISSVQIISIDPSNDE